jgi:hypothetical protein
MKHSVFVFGLLLSGMALPSVKGADSAGKLPPGPVSELRIQDSVFSLLIESYREMQTVMIEADYDKRLRAASLVKDEKQRDHIHAQERELRLAKLRDIMQNFATAYGTSRQVAEQKTGVNIPNEADAKTANAQLHKLVPFTPKQFGPGENQPSQLLPAGAQIIYSQNR